jgi:PAS domain S-box-containing protein
MEAVRATGDRIPVELVITRLDMEGEPLFAGWVRDLTERRRAAEALSASERRLRALIDASADGLVLTDRRMQAVLTNRAATELARDDGASADGSVHWELVHPDDRERVAQEILELEPGGVLEQRYRLEGGDGRYHWVEMRTKDARDDPDLGGYVASVRDITDQVKAQQALREAEERYRTLVEQIPAITFIEAADPTGPLGYRTVYASPQVESILGYSPAEWIADPELWEKLLVEEDRQRAVAENEAATLERRPFHVRYRLRARDGRIVWMREDSKPLLDERGDVIAWHGVLFDVTEEEQSREALRRSAERLETLHAIDLAILSGHTTGRLAADTAATIRRMVAADRVSLVVIDEKQNEARYVGVSQVASLGPEEGAVVPIENGRLHFSGREPRYIPDVSKVPDPPAALRAAPALGIRSVLSGPLMAGDRVIGALSVSSTRVDAFSPADIEVIREVADQLAIALEQDTLRERLEQRVAEGERLIGDLRRVDDARRNLLSQLVVAEEKERQTIAEGIHDDSIQMMTAVGIRLDSLRRKLTDEDHLETLDRIADAVSDAISRLRLLLFELHPRALDHGRLGDAIRSYLELWSGGEGPKYAFEDRLETALPPVPRTTAYRIVQEALANCRKHSGAGHVWITLATEDGGVHGTIEDDGIGIGDVAESVPGHIGITAMRDRAERAGGWVRIGDRDGDGTQVEFWLPA